MTREIREIASSAPPVDAPAPRETTAWVIATDAPAPPGGLLYFTGADSPLTREAWTERHDRARRYSSRTVAETARKVRIAGDFPLFGESRVEEHMWVDAPADGDNSFAQEETEHWLEGALGVYGLTANERDIASYIRKLRVEVGELRAQLAALRADREDLDWLDGQWMHGVHVEVWAKGNADVQVRPCATVYARGDYQAGSVREAIRAARRAHQDKE